MTARPPWHEYPPEAAAVIRSWDERGMVWEEGIRFGATNIAERRVIAEAIWSFLRGIRAGEEPIIAGAVALTDVDRLLPIVRGEADEKERWRDTALALVAEAVWDVWDVLPPRGLLSFVREPVL